MSYILDALKKAESERKLGSIPNVYAPAPNVMAMPDEGSRRTRLPWILTAAAILLLLACLAWLQPWSQPARVASTPAPTSAVAPDPMPAPAPIATAPAIAPTPVPASPPPVPQTKPMPIVTEVAKKAKPVVAPAVASAPVAASPVQPAPIAVEAKPPSKETVAAEIVPDEDSVGTIRNLPRAIQAEVPTFTVNGYIYARNPVDRSVLINQKLLHEGDQITPELVLEKMLPKGAILNYKGYRYRVAF
ncbi:MAG TPA: general secretion pathway protein GspB [Burkholderiaceae bacterium]|jgi:general secretion pathway protein B|nr:general secretion pathway protein GspB [Burkholderiaceae bacterium]